MEKLTSACRQIRKEVSLYGFRLDTFQIAVPAHCFHNVGAVAQAVDALDLGLAVVFEFAAFLLALVHLIVLLSH